MVEMPKKIESVAAAGIVSSKMNSSKMNNSNEKSEAMPRTTIGAAWIQNPVPWWVPVGLEKTQGPNATVPAYRNIFFGGKRDYKDDEDGWQIYHSRGYLKRLKRANRGRNPNYGVYEEETYEFDDGQM